MVSSLSNHTTTRHFLYACSLTKPNHVYGYVCVLYSKGFRLSTKKKGSERNATALLETPYGFDRFYNFDGGGYARSDAWRSRSRCAGYPLFSIRPPPIAAAVTIEVEQNQLAPLGHLPYCEQWTGTLPLSRYASLPPFSRDKGRALAGGHNRTIDRTAR